MVPRKWLYRQIYGRAHVIWAYQNDGIAKLIIPSKWWSRYRNETVSWKWWSHQRYGPIKMVSLKVRSHENDGPIKGTVSWKWWSHRRHGPTTMIVLAKYWSRQDDGFVKMMFSPNWISRENDDLTKIMVCTWLSYYMMVCYKIIISPKRWYHHIDAPTKMMVLPSARPTKGLSHQMYDPVKMMVSPNWGSHHNCFVSDSLSKGWSHQYEDPPPKSDHICIPHIWWSHKKGSYR